MRVGKGAVGVEADDGGGRRRRAARWAARVHLHCRMPTRGRFSDQLTQVNKRQPRPAGQRPAWRPCHADALRRRPTPWRGEHLPPEPSGIHALRRRRVGRRGGQGECPNRAPKWPLPSEPEVVPGAFTAVLLEGWARSLLGRGPPECLSTDRSRSHGEPLGEVRREEAWLGPGEAAGALEPCAG